MKFRYVGEPLANGERQTNLANSITYKTANGLKAYRFSDGKAVEVDDAELARRLSGSSHFEVVTDEEAVAEAEADELVSKVKKGRKGR